MRTSLYDVLRGRFYDGTPVDVVPEREQRLHSVLSNLNRLFNTRQDALLHLPEYGLPEAAAIYRDADYPIAELQKDIKEAVERYEPRLRRVHVERLADADDDIRLSFLISAEMEDGEKVRFKTTIAANDLVHVDSYKRQE